MIYNEIKKIWILTNDEIVEEEGINLATLLEESEYQVSKLKDIENLLQDLSIRLYSYIYSFNPTNKKVLEFYLNKYAKDLVKTCLYYELEYLIKNGDFWNFAGISQIKGQINDINEIRNIRRLISPQTEMLLNSERVGEYPLLYQGEYPYIYKISIKD